MAANDRVVSVARLAEVEDDDNGQDALF